MQPIPFSMVILKQIFRKPKNDIRYNKIINGSKIILFYDVRMYIRYFVSTPIT